MLNKYNDFILEKLLTESVIHFAPPFRKALNRISNEPIAKKLLGIERDNIKPDITFVNLDKEGYVSFTTMRNAKKILSSQFNFPEDRMENILDNDEEIGDDIAKTTVDIFYDFDKQLDKPLDTTKYKLLPITKGEIKSIICHTLLFIIAIYLLYINTPVRKYLLVIFILTFLIITIDIYFI
jgi:hypothetical protein